MRRFGCIQAALRINPDYADAHVRFRRGRMGNMGRTD